MTREAGPWRLGTLPPWMEWDFQSLPTANGRMVKKNILGLLLIRHSSACLVHQSNLLYLMPLVLPVMILHN